MRTLRQFTPALLLGTWLVAACSSSEGTSNKKAGDGGPTGDATGASGSGADGGSSSSAGGHSSAAGGASAGAGTSGGGTSGAGASGGGGAASGGGGASTGGTAGGAATGGTSSGGGTTGGTGGRNAGGACGNLAACCPTAGIFRPSCEQQVATGMATNCSVLTGLYCQADAGARVVSDAGGQCTDLRACCATLTATSKTQCNQIADLGNENACAQIHTAYCP